MSFKRFVAVGDNHGDLIHRKDAEAFLSFVDSFKPQYRIHLGDNFDFRNLRRGADPREEGDDMAPDLNAGFDFIDKYRPTHFLCGNHDYRLWRATEDARGLVRQYARDGVAEIKSRLGKSCEFRPYHFRAGVLTIGDLNFLHGYHCGENATMQHARIYGRCIFGHLHRNDSARARRLDVAEAVCVGGLGDHESMTYADQRTATLAWGRGWAYGVINDRTGQSAVWTAKKIGEKWLLPESIKEV
jgi:predicted phosphodiesterase